MNWARLWLLSCAFGLIHANISCENKAQEIFEKHSKDASEAIVHYLAEMITITYRDSTPELKTEQMISELQTLKDTIVGVIEAAESPTKPWKIFIGTGFPRRDHTYMEIIDLKNPSNSCEQRDYFPIGVDHATGGLVQENKLLICGGSDKSSIVRQECYLATKDGIANIVNMTTARHASSSVVHNQDLLVFGGQDSNNNGIHTIERVSIATNSSEIIGEMPVAYNHGCVLSYEQDSIVAISGVQDGRQSPAIWMSTFSNLTTWRGWTRGPNLDYGRSWFGCALLETLKMAVVAGGESSPTEMSSELILLNENKVVAGPSLPLPLEGPSILSHPEEENTLILTGGYGYGDLNNKIFKLTCSSATSCGDWIEMGQKLRIPRNYHLSFVVPADFNCTST